MEENNNINNNNKLKHRRTSTDIMHNMYTHLYRLYMYIYKVSNLNNVGTVTTKAI